VSRYAEGTAVAPEKSRAEVEQLFRKAGAARVMIDSDDAGGIAQIAVHIKERWFKFQVLRPTLDEAKTEWKKGAGRRRYAPKSGELEKLADQEWRRRWRVLVLVSKAKLELISSGESSVEREFMADLVMPGGRTLHEYVTPAIAEAYANGALASPPRLGSGR